MPLSNSTLALYAALIVELLTLNLEASLNYDLQLQVPVLLHISLERSI